MGQTPKVHLLQAVGMLVIGEMSQWRDDKRVGVLMRERREMALTADPLDVTDDPVALWETWDDRRPSYSNQFVKVSPVVIFCLVV